MKGIIYKATNTLDGRVYVGQTRVCLAKRKSQHIHDSKRDSKNLFHLALYQYADLFDWEVLDTFSGTEEQVIHALNVAEEYYIIKHNSTDPRYGYNSTMGGYSSDKFADYIQRQISGRSGDRKAVLQYDAEGNFIREFPSQASVANYLGISKFRIGEASLSYGYQWREKKNEYYPRKIGAYVKPTKPYKRVLVYDSTGAFVKDCESANMAAKEFGVGVIRDGFCGIEAYRGTLRPYYAFSYADGYPERINITIKEKRQRTATQEKVNPAIAVLAYDPKSGAFVAEYASMSEARKQSGASDSTIRRSAHLPEPVRVESPKQKYVWRKKDGEVKERIDIIPYEVKTIERKKMEHRIIQYSLDGEFVKVWGSASEASQATGEPYGSIYRQLRGGEPARKAKYLWKYYSEERGSDSRVETKKRADDVIYELDRAGERIGEYNGTAEAASRIGISQAYVCNILAKRVRHPKHRLIRKADYERKYGA